MPKASRLGPQTISYLKPQSRIFAGNSQLIQRHLDEVTELLESLIAVSLELLQPPAPRG